MNILRRIFSGLFIAVFATTQALAMTSAEREIILRLHGPVGLVAGQAMGLTITTQNLTSISDLGVSPFVNGFTGDLTLKHMVPATSTPAATTAAYQNCSTQTGCPNYTSPLLALSVTSPGFTSAAAPTTVSGTFGANAWLRQVFPAGTSAVTAANGGNGQIGLTFADFVYAHDTVRASLSGSGAAALYAGTDNVTGASLFSKPTANIPVTNNSTRAFPQPICAWVTEPGLRFDGTANATVEAFCGQAYGQGGVPVAAVKILMSDGTNTVSHTIGTPTASKRQYSSTGTATLGSNVIQGLASVAGFKVGQRVIVNGIPGQPVIGAIDTAAGGNCGTPPCLELFTQTLATPTALGALVISSNPTAPMSGAGVAWADGAFVGQRIQEPSGNGFLGGISATGNVKVVAPSVACGASQCTNSTTSLTLPAPAQGQWASGMFLYDANTSAPCIPIDQFDNESEFISALGTGAGGAGTYTLKFAPLSTNACEGHTLTGLGIAATPAVQTYPASLTISTGATSGTATQDTFQFDYDYQGASGAVTVTAGSPVPVYAATFTPTDFAALTPNVPIFFRLQAFPIIGDQVLDSQTPNFSALNSNCDWFYFNFGTPNLTGACNSGNAAFFLANGQQVSPNLHNLFAYYDTAATQSYAPAYAWVNANGTATACSAIQTSQGTYPGNSLAFATIAAAQTALKAFNDNTSPCAGSRATAHNDINGGVFCLTDASYSGFGVALTTTAWKPGATFTSAATSTTNCPAPGQLATNPGVTLAGAATNANPGLGTRFQNLTFAQSTSDFILRGADTGSLVAFPSYYVIIDNVLIQPISGSNLTVVQIGAFWVYDSIDNESAFRTSVASPSNGANALTLGSTFICGAFTSPLTQWTPYSILGSLAWNCDVNTTGVGLATTGQTLNPWALSQVIAYDRFMGIFGQPAPESLTFAANNILLTENVFETLDRAINEECLEFDADGYSVPVNNVVFEYNSCVGGRYNSFYAEGEPIAGTATTGGTLTTSTTYTTQVAFGLIGTLGASAIPTSTDGNAVGAQGISLAIGANTALIFELPCDFLHFNWIYIDTQNTAPLAHLADVAAFTATSAGANLTLSALSAGTLYPGATLATTGGATVVTAGGVPVQIASCPSNVCTNATGTYQLSGTPSTALSGNFVAQATQLQSCQTVKAIAVDAGSNAAPQESSTFPARSYLKTAIFDRFNNLTNIALKNDYFNFGIANGGRITNWERTHGVSTIGDVYVTSTNGEPYFGTLGTAAQTSSQGGEVVPWNTAFSLDSVVQTFTDMHLVRYAVGDDRSVGGGQSSAPPTGQTNYPGLNIGMGDYCPTSGSATAGRVPSGLAAWPWDVSGIARLNNGSGWAGAYESGCK